MFASYGLLHNTAPITLQAAVDYLQYLTFLEQIVRVMVLYINRHTPLTSVPKFLEQLECDVCESYRSLHTTPPILQAAIDYKLYPPPHTHTHTQTQHSPRWEKTKGCKIQQTDSEGQEGVGIVGEINNRSNKNQNHS